MTSESVSRRMAELFTGSYLCAESVVQVIAEAGGRESADAVRAATGFCSGMARTCGQCGAVSGAVMGLGLFAGRSEPGGDHEACYALVQEFLAGFRKAYGSLNCFELIGCDFANPEDQARYKRDDLRKTCYGMAVHAAELALSILREHGYLAERDAFVRSRLAPCGLLCGTCVAFAGGPVQRAGAELRRALGPNFGEYARRFASMNPVFSRYPAFAELLDYLASGACTGCREQGCLFQACKVADCAGEHGVDYCFRCTEFPCDRHGLPDRLAEVWRGNNEKMRECGAEAWFCKLQDKPRYP